MGTLPLRDGLTSQLTASYVSGKLTVTARRDAGWQQPALFIDSMEDVDFGKPSFTSRGDTLTATVPVTDSWGEAAPDLSGKRCRWCWPIAVRRRKANRRRRRQRRGWR
jgi:suppressor for copper-sensitivity B